MFANNIKKQHNIYFQSNSTARVARLVFNTEHWTINVNTAPSIYFGENEDLPLILGINQSINVNRYEAANN